MEEDEDEDGHTVVATARGVFNSNGGVLSSIETGVSIIIPQGAIPEGVEQEIYVKVCRDNSILPPLDKEKGGCAPQAACILWQAYQATRQDTWAALRFLLLGRGLPASSGCPPPDSSVSPQPWQL